MTSRGPSKKDEVLDPAALQLLGEALAPAALREEQRASMRARIMGRLADAPPPNTETIRSGSIPWRNVSSGVEAKVLKRDDQAGVIIVLWRLEPGGVVPGHTHTEEEDEECFVLEGEMLVGKHCVRAGELHIAKRGGVHEDLTTRTGCVVMLRSGISPLLAKLFPL
jgi:quercetin dioxygenase-like cupin family protein